MTGRFTTGDSPVSYPNFLAFPQPLPGRQNISQPKLTRAASPRSVLLAGARGGMTDMVCKTAGDDKRKLRPILRRRRYRSQIGKYGQNDVMRCFFKSAGGLRPQKKSP